MAKEKKYKDPLLKRLAYDQHLVEEFCANSDVVSYKILNENDDMPADHYLFTYKVKSITSVSADQVPSYGNHHEVEIKLPSGYPMMSSPICYMKTEIWHPNIRHSGKFKGHICINAQVLGSWQTLDMLIYQIGEMIQYQNYHALNIQPYPEDPNVAKWVREYGEPNKIVDLENGIAVDDTILLNPTQAWLDNRNKSNLINILSIKLKNQKKVHTIKSLNRKKIVIKK